MEPSDRQTLLSARILFGHQSVGQDVLAGMTEAVAGLKIIPSAQWHGEAGPVLIDAVIGANGDPGVAPCRALSGLVVVVCAIPQGVALGWYVTPLWGWNRWGPNAGAGWRSGIRRLDSARDPVRQSQTALMRQTAAAYGLESQLLAERDILVDIGRRRGGYSPSDEEDITSLGNIVRLYGRKQHWGVKLAALQQSVPDGVTVTSFAGQVMQAVRVRAGLMSAKQPGKHNSENPERRKHPHPKRMASGVCGTRAGVVVCPTNCEVQPGHSDVLNHRHQTIRRSDLLLLDNVCDRRPHDGRNE